MNGKTAERLMTIRTIQTRVHDAIDGLTGLVCHKAEDGKHGKTPKHTCEAVDNNNQQTVPKQKETILVTR